MGPKKRKVKVVRFVDGWCFECQRRMMVPDDLGCAPLCPDHRIKAVHLIQPSL